MNKVGMMERPLFTQAEHLLGRVLDYVQLESNQTGQKRFIKQNVDFQEGISQP